MEARRAGRGVFLLPGVILGIALFAFLSINAGDPAAILLSEQVLFELPVEKGYSYTQLPEAEKRVYREIHYSLLHRMEDVLVSTKDPECLDKVFNAFLNDHPEIFYTEGYSCFSFKRDNDVQRLFFSPDYGRDYGEVLDARAGIDLYMEDFLQKAASCRSDYEKAKLAYDHLISHVDYDNNAPDSQNICSVFLNGKSVCTGYAKGLQYMLKACGIPSVMLTGIVRENVPHAWLAVFLDGDWYHVDPAWGDPSYQVSEGLNVNPSSLPEISYDYFLVTDHDIERTHRVDNPVKPPECVSRKDNYYVREGAYFKELDTAQLEDLFEKAYRKGETYLTVKCADGELYSRMRTYLLNEQHIFEYLEGSDNAVAYTDKPEVFSISFWL